MSLNSFNMITQIYEAKASTKHISSDSKRNLLIENVIQIKVGITIHIICTIKIMYAKRIMIRILVHEFVSVENIVKLIYIHIYRKYCTCVKSIISYIWSTCDEIVDIPETVLINYNDEAETYKPNYHYILSTFPIWNKIVNENCYDFLLLHESPVTILIM